MTEHKLPDDPASQKALIEARFRYGAKKMEQLASQIGKLEEANRKQDEMLCQIHKNTDDLVEMWQAGEGAVKVLRWIGKIAAWLGGIATAATAIWYAFTNWPRGGL